MQLLKKWEKTALGYGYSFTCFTRCWLEHNLGMFFLFSQFPNPKTIWPCCLMSRKDEPGLAAWNGEFNYLVRYWLVGWAAPSRGQLAVECTPSTVNCVLLRLYLSLHVLHPQSGFSLWKHVAAITFSQIHKVVHFVVMKDVVYRFSASFQGYITPSFHNIREWGLRNDLPSSSKKTFRV